MDMRLTRRNVAASASAGALALALTNAAGAQESASPVASPAATFLPDTPAGNQLGWVLAVINGDEPIPDEAVIEEHFAGIMLEAMPAAQLIATFEQLQAQLAPISVIEIVGRPTPLAIDALIEAVDGTRLVASVTVDREAPHLIIGLLFQPADQQAPEIPSLSSWAELDDALNAAGPNTAVSATKLGADGEAETVHELNPEAVMPIGSAFKLYVLGALSTAIEAGKLKWTDEIELTDELLSLPSGVTQNEEIGSTFSLEELAKRMISISDNTATDMVMAAVGRDACEAALEAMGNSVPERNRPFLNTRELFTIKLSDPALLDAYVAADEQERRELLETTIAEQPLPPIDQALVWTSPIAIDTVEWFATMADLGRAMAWLRDASERPGLEPVREILTMNPGVPHDTEIWPVVAFKGGSEVGVIAFSWLLERADGERFTFAAAVSNPDSAIPEDEVAIAAAGAFALLTEA